MMTYLVKLQMCHILVEGILKFELKTHSNQRLIFFKDSPSDLLIMMIAFKPK